MLSNCNEILDPTSLTPNVLTEIHETLQDMWSTALWELVRCHVCDTIFGKKEIFWHLPIELYRQTVSNILRQSGRNDIPCPHCEWDTEFIYGDEHLANLIEKIKTSVYSYIQLYRGENREIQWIGLYYIDTFSEIFHHELSPHYETIGEQWLHRKIEKTLWFNPGYMIAFAAIWFREWYGNMNILFEILKNAFTNIPYKYRASPGIMEVDQKNAVYRVFTHIGGIPLDLESSHISNTREFYKSKILCFHHPVESFENHFSTNLPSFIKNFRWSQQTRTVTLR